MLHWAKPCKEPNLSLTSKIPISQIKRKRYFKMNDNRQPKVKTNAPLNEATKTVDEINHAFGIAESAKKGHVESKLELNGIMAKRNIETDVFDWLSKNGETTDKYTGYCLENNTNDCVDDEDIHNRANSEEIDSKNSEESLETSRESEPVMAYRGNGTDAGTKSYFNAFKNAIFPFAEGKYFYLSGELNSQKVSLTETIKTNGDKSGHVGDKTSCKDDKYKEILGDRRGENETKKTGGLKDTKWYNKEQRMVTGDNNGYVKYKMDYNGTYDNITPMKINLKLENSAESQQNEINRLRAQLETLSAFVERSDERQEQSEILLAEQKEELLKQIREKEVLDNRVCCLEELRRNLQRKVDDISGENKSLKIALKSNEEKLIQEKEKVSVLKKECSTEITKNVELELVLQTIREELGCPTPKGENTSDIALGTSRDDSERDWNESREDDQILEETGPSLEAKHKEKKVTWGNITVQSQKVNGHKNPQSPALNEGPQCRGVGTRKPHTKDKPESETTHAVKTHYSCLKHHTSDEAIWKREKKQFEGKVLLLEMDKKKLRSQIDSLEEKIDKQENVEQNLRENSEVLEFRILELEYELMEKTKKVYL